MKCFLRKRVTGTSRHTRLIIIIFFLLSRILSRSHRHHDNRFIFTHFSRRYERDTMLSREASRLSKTCMVACNIYVSAGTPHYAPFLLQLLEDAQQHCRQLRHNTSDKNSSHSNNHSLTVVHAYADGPYDRSSFHVAGSPCLVADIASRIATRAVQGPSLGAP
jgi:hypothetical protein